MEDLQRHLSNTQGDKFRQRLKGGNLTRFIKLKLCSILMRMYLPINIDDITSVGATTSELSRSFIYICTYVPV